MPSPNAVVGLVSALLGERGIRVLQPPQSDPALDIMSDLLGHREACRTLGATYIGPRKKCSTPARERRNKRNKSAKLARRRNRR